MIERAHLRDHDGIERHPLSGAPPRIRAIANRKRAAAGLSPILSADELLEVEARVARMEAEALAATRGPAIWIDPASRLAPKGVAPAANGYFPVGRGTWSPAATPARRSTTNYRTTVLLVVGHGLARGHGSPGTIGKRLDKNVYGTADELNVSPGWTLRAGHHGGILAMAGPALRAVESDVVPLVAQWVPDMTRSDHVAAVRRIEAGERGVSANYVVADRRVMRLPEPVDVVLTARLVHLALLPADDDPAFPAAFATVFRSRPDTPNELRRQLAEVEKAARWRAAEAERVGR